MSKNEIVFFPFSIVVQLALLDYLPEYLPATPQPHFYAMAGVSQSMLDLYDIYPTSVNSL